MEMSIRQYILFMRVLYVQGITPAELAAYYSYPETEIEAELDELEKLGLVEKHVATKTYFRGKNMEAVITFEAAQFQ